MLHIGLATLESMEAASPFSLSAAEQARLHGLSNPARRQEFLACRALLRALMRHACGEASSNWTLSATACEPVRIAQRPDLHLSLSHSRGYLLAAIADAPVGVDIELPRRGRAVLDMAEQICHPAEADVISRIPAEEAAQAFLTFWTQKEAWLKARSLGLDWALMRKLCLQPQQDEFDCCSWQDQAMTLSVHSSALAEKDAVWMMLAPPPCVAQGRLADGCG